jgi:hypothetical protein
MFLTGCDRRQGGVRGPFDRPADRDGQIHDESSGVGVVEVDSGLGERPGDGADGGGGDDAVVAGRVRSSQEGQEPVGELDAEMLDLIVGVTAPKTSPAR